MRLSQTTPEVSFWIAFGVVGMEFGELVFVSVDAGEDERFFVE